MWNFFLDWIHFSLRITKPQREKKTHEKLLYIFCTIKKHATQLFASSCYSSHCIHYPYRITHRLQRFMVTTVFSVCFLLISVYCAVFVWVCTCVRALCSWTFHRTINWYVLYREHSSPMRKIIEFTSVYSTVQCINAHQLPIIIFIGTAGGLCCFWITDVNIVTMYSHLISGKHDETSQTNNIYINTRHLFNQ